MAKTTRWDGGHASSNNWSEASNWDNGAPAAGDTIEFGGTTRLTPNNNLTADISFAAITFVSGAGAFTIGGNRITLGGSITNMDADLQTINLDIVMSGNRKFYTTIGNITVGGIISGAFYIDKESGNDNTLTLSGVNTYSGGTWIERATVSVGTIVTIAAGSSNLGSGGTIWFGDTINTGTLKYTGTGNTTDRVVDLYGSTGGAVIEQAGTGLLKFTANLTASTAGAKTLTLQGSTAGTGEIAGVIVNSSSGATSLVKSGTGTWTLSGTNTYTGATTVSAGTLQITGSTHASSAVTVKNTGILAGTGTINGSITQESGSTIAPGVDGIGTLNTANVTMVSGSIYSVELDGATPTFDKINSTGTVVLGSSTLTVANIANAAIGKIYTIVGAAAVSGTFAGLPSGATFAQQGRRFRIVYSATTVTLTDCSNWVRDVISSIDSKNVTGTAATWVTANSYSFSAAANNLILGMSPTENTNLAAGQEGTGAVTMLTNGAMVASKPNVYTIGALWSFDTCYMVYTLGSQGYDITGINLYTWWSDAGRDDIYMSSISCSTVAAPTTFTAITGAGVYYESSTGSAKASLVSVGGALATNVYAIKFLFGGQQNYYVGWAEIEVIGTTS